ncbi:hypothetical protein ZIOFF_056596 [Zingiber officinale]|uniref:Uncharacterized protein n=1 Tax=Zingiber officinale TaxID=94328 RepID=A0A8J5FNT7_ZINOF|nr:hypothetical protein ZIOFF_056596 [Zingiber officinale]
MAGLSSADDLDQLLDSTNTPFLSHARVQFLDFVIDSASFLCCRRFGRFLPDRSHSLPEERSQYGWESGRGVSVLVVFLTASKGMDGPAGPGREEEGKAEDRGSQHPRHWRAEETREAVRGLESATRTTNIPEGANAEMVEEFVKQFEAEMAGSQDVESIVETMMQQLLSKEILHDPMKEIGERYPKWLEEHKDVLNKQDYDRYRHQYELILKLNEVYDNEPENFSKIVDLMQKMQECGQPPSDIVQELAPDLDLSNLGQLSPDQIDAAANCSVM